MNNWSIAVFLSPASDEPVYLQITHALMREIGRGRFKPGDVLPGYRRLARQLGVGRNTVLSAYRELQAEGFVVAAPGAGSTVASCLPPYLPSAAAPCAPAAAAAPGCLPGGTMGFDLRHAIADVGLPTQDGLLDVATGNPDPRLLPSVALARAYRRALTLNRGSAQALADPQGHPRLRHALARMLASSHGIAASAETIMVIRSGQMALFLVAQALFEPGDAVAVEALGPPGVWEACARAGARCLPLPVDAGGLRIDVLAALLAKTHLRAVFVGPCRQYPTLASLLPERRQELLTLAARHRFAVVESDQDSEFQFDGRREPPLAALDGDGVVVHIGVLSKIFTPGLRLGFVHAPSPVIAAMRAARLSFDPQGDLVLERAMAELMEDGEIQRHLNRMHPIYRQRRDALCAALAVELGDSVSFERPAGGLSLWVRVAAGVDVDAWSTRAIERGVAFRSGRQFSPDSRVVQALRMGFSNYPEALMEDVARRLAAALPRAGS